jgi:hypothetical protein
MKADREGFSGYEMDLMAAWITHVVDSSDPDVNKLLASLDGERFLLYKGMRDRTHTVNVCANPVY